MKYDELKRNSIDSLEELRRFKMQEYKTYRGVDSENATRSRLSLKTHDQKRLHNFKFPGPVMEENKEEHTCETKPSIPMRSIIASHKMFVGITG